MEADHPQFEHLPQPLGHDGNISDDLAGMLHPDQAWLVQRRFRRFRYDSLPNGYSMLTLEDETGCYYLVFDKDGHLIPGVFDSAGKARGAAEQDWEERRPRPSPQ